MLQLSKQRHVELSTLTKANVGSLGLDTAYVPLVPYSRVPLVLALGSVREIAAVRDGELVAKKTMNVNATFDHRFIDGKHAAVMSSVIRRWFGEPDKYFGTPESALAELGQAPPGSEEEPADATVS